MKRVHSVVSLSLCMLMWLSSSLAQQASTAGSTVVIPRLIRFAGTLKDSTGHGLTGVAGITFSLYREQEGGAALWLETQNVALDANGRYDVLLGAEHSEGVPVDLFTSGDARWLGVRVNGNEEQPRVLLLSVPYALKAADAETLGGKPASAFQLVVPQSKSDNIQTAPPPIEQPNEISCVGSTACKTSFIPMFSSNGGSAKVSDSIITQSGTTIKVAGKENVSGNLSSSGNLVVSGNVNASSATVTNTSGAAIYGTSHGTSAGSDGVDGLTYSPTASGVAGINPSGGVGVYGTDNGSLGIGVYGIGLTGVYGIGPGGGTGVWGQGAPGVGGMGVEGTAADYFAGYFENDSPDGYYTLWVRSENAASAPFSTSGAGGSCTIDASGNLNCTGSKNAIVPLDGGNRKVALSAIESPENWFEDFGSAQLVNGVVVVRLDPDYIQTVNTEKEYNVFLTPYGDCKGLYVTNRRSDSFEVHELGGGTASLSFGYRITAIRRKCETVRFADHTNDPDPKKMLEQMRKSRPASSSAPELVKPALPPAGGSVSQGW